MVTCDDCGITDQFGGPGASSLRLPVGWSRVYLTVKHQMSETTDIRSQMATRIKITKNYCEKCSKINVQPKVDIPNQKLEFTISV